MVLDKSVKIHIGDKDYKLCFPIKELFECEKELNSGNLLTTLSNQPPSIGDLYIMFTHAIKGGKNDVTDMEELWGNAIDETSMRELAQHIYEAIGKSGVFGKKILAALPKKKA